MRIVNLEEINGMLLRVSELVDLYQGHGAGFAEKVSDWLESLEKALNNNRMPVVGNVAALRGMLISAEHGVMPESLRLHGKVTSRKIKDAAASEVLRAAVEFVSKAVQPDSSTVTEAERQGRHIVVLARAKGLSLAIPDGPDRTGALKNLWRILAADPDIGPGTVNVESLVGPHDALIILDRSIARDAPSG